MEGCEVVVVVGVLIGVVSMEGGMGLGLEVCWAGGAVGGAEGVELGVSITMVGGAGAAIVYGYEMKSEVEKKTFSKA
jgi:hypothetical protein